MVRRSRRELEIAEHLWDCLNRIAEDCGTDRHMVVNQAIYELARRFNFLKPAEREVPAMDNALEAAPSPGQARAPEPVKQAPRPKPPRPKKQLYVVNSAGDMCKIEKDTFIIGRSRTCDLVIPSSKVSRQHGSVVRENGEYFIDDLGSANGVWKDGVRINKEKIRDGDEFMISEEVLKFIFR